MKFCTYSASVRDRALMGQSVALMTIAIFNKKLYKLNSAVITLSLSFMLFYFICFVLLCVYRLIFSFSSIFYSFCVFFLSFNPPPLLASQDHPAQRHLPPERTQHVFPSQCGRVCDVPQVEGQQRERQRIH